MAKTSIDLPAKRYFQKLVFNIGAVIRVNKPLASDAIRVGRCNFHDKWPQCTGGCNELEKGNGCAHCSAGAKASVEIKCN